MILTIVFVLVILWLLGFLFHFTIAGAAWLIHVLLVVAIIIVLVRVIQGRRLM